MTEAEEQSGIMKKPYHASRNSEIAERSMGKHFLTVARTIEYSKSQAALLFCLAGESRHPGALCRGEPVCAFLCRADTQVCPYLDPGFHRDDCFLNFNLLM